MTHYLIKLYPHDKFFFGIGKEFGINNQNYFVESSYFPQQTTLLGMLRYQLLCQSSDDVFKNNKIQDSKKAANLIGKKSFAINENNTFGKINSISPVFVMIDDQNYYPLNREYQSISKEKENQVDWQLVEVSQDLTLLKNYETKKGLPDLLVNEEGKIYRYSDIFREVEQVGINKNYEGKSEDNAFYLQQYMKFKHSNSCFAFYVESEIEIKDNHVVFLGGERQTFNMTVEKVKNPKTEFSAYYKAPYKSSRNVHKVILLCDAYIEHNIKDYCEFAITDLVRFRCLQAKTSTKNYDRVKRMDENMSEYKKTNLHKSTEIELYARGSVFYFSDESKLKEFTHKLELSEFFKIGYNHYKIVTKN